MNWVIKCIVGAFTSIAGLCWYGLDLSAISLFGGGFLLFSGLVCMVSQAVPEEGATC